MSLRLCVASILLSMLLSNANAKPHQPIDSIDVLDELITLCLEYLTHGKIDEAGLLARQMTHRFPNFSLGHLIAAEMDSVQALQDVSISDHLPIARNVSELLLEARKRLATQRIQRTPKRLSSQQHTRKQTLPRDLIQIGSYLSHILVVDLELSVLYQYDVRFQRPVLVRQHYIGSGEGGSGKRLEGDLKTPLGVYSVTEFRNDESLPDLYGAGALTLDYPNTLDQYLGRTGYGIWLHGVPALQQSRTPYSSEGCVTMSNEHLSRLARELDASSTKVILTNDAAALDHRAQQDLQRQFHQLFKTYQQAQITGDEKQLRRLYHNKHIYPNNASGNALPGPLAVRKPADGKSIDKFEQFFYQPAFSSIQLDEISIFRHPDINHQDSGFSSLVVTEAAFGASNEYQVTVYWAQNEHGHWQVLTEKLAGPGI